MILQNTDLLVLQRSRYKRVTCMQLFITSVNKMLAIPLYVEYALNGGVWSAEREKTLRTCEYMVYLFCGSQSTGEDKP